MPDQELSVDDAFQLGLQKQKQGHLDEAASLFRSILQAVPAHAPSLHFLGIILYQQGNTVEALELLNRSIALRPSEITFRQNLGGLLKDAERYEEALPYLQEVVESEPDHAVALSNLSQAYYRLNRNQEAIEYGQRSLEAKHRQACTAGKPLLTAEQLQGHPRPFRSDTPTRNVIAFSLWGSDSYYRRGAVINAQLARYLYPEWSCRFYCDLSVPQDVIARLNQEGARVIQFNQQTQGNVGLFWRFLVANDPDVDRFLCRDCDSWLNVKERVAVEAWLASDYCFHVMRDNIIHTELMLAGMWGGVAGVLPDIRQMSAAYLQKYGQRWTDQHFLREEIWPLIHEQTLTHDAFYSLGKTEPFPRFGTLPRPQHVGCSMPRT